MKHLFIFVISCLSIIPCNIHAQSIILDIRNIEPVNVSVKAVKLMGKVCIKVLKDSHVKEVDEPTFVKVKGIKFKNGTIEVKVLSRLLQDAPDFARGFIGVAFRINDSNTKYESFYIRPVNARVNDQVRRNHTIQYYSYPDFKYDRLRKESPERYESYADMEMDTWIAVKIQVRDAEAKIFINGNTQPSLIVSDLKLGKDLLGDIGLWVEVGTEGYFSDLKIQQE